MNNYLVKISFLGTNFNGTQIQPGLLTIQGLFTDLINKFSTSEVKITCCSRLDKSVHAEVFYFNFKIDKELDLYKLKCYLNNFTPDFVGVDEIRKVNIDFSSRYHAVSKTYRYNIYFGKKRPFINEISYHSPFKLIRNTEDIDFSIFVGEHDFINFSSDDDATSYISTIDEISYTYDKNNECFSFYITAKMFFRYQVRYIVGAIYELLTDRKSEDEIKLMLSGQKYTKPKLKLDGKGLTLVNVLYNKEDLDV